MARHFRTARRGAARRECAIIRTDGSLDAVAGGGAPGDAVVAAIDDFGAARVAADVPAAAAAIYRLYLPLCWQRDGFAVGHLGQSLDGRIATRNGASQFVTGPCDILHIHRMRALFDTIIVGAGTVALDDPQLTTRLCDGDSPVRVVIDTERRLDKDFRLFRESTVPTLVFCAADRMNGATRLGSAELVGIERCAEGVSPRAVRGALSARGYRRHYIEGGGVTVSRFLDAGCLDRLQITVSPMIIGSGRPAFTLPEVASLSDSLRPETRRFDLGDDVMFECLFDG